MDLSLDQVLESLNKYKDIILLGGFGLVMLILGVREWQQAEPPPDLITAEEAEDQVIGDVVVDISGAVNRPGVYRFEIGTRTSQAIEAAEGFSSDANLEWVSKNFNLAEELLDGRKIYVPFINEDTASIDSALSNSANSSVNVNKASLEELKQLDGIGDVRAQSIIENRPYQSMNDLESKADLPKSILDQNANKISFF